MVAQQDLKGMLRKLDLLASIGGSAASQFPGRDQRPLRSGPEPTSRDTESYHVSTAYATLSAHEGAASKCRQTPRSSAAVHRAGETEDLELADWLRAHTQALEED